MIISPYLVHRWRICGAKSHLLLCNFKTWTGTNLTHKYWGQLYPLTNLCAQFSLVAWLLIRIRFVSSSKLGWDSGYTDWVFWWIRLVRPWKFRGRTSLMSRPLSSKSLQIYSSKVILLSTLWSARTHGVTFQTTVTFTVSKQFFR